MPRNPNLVLGWQMPRPPMANYTPIALLHADGEVELDFYDRHRRTYASAAFLVDEDTFRWPWRDDYIPTEADWKSIGFQFINMEAEGEKLLRHIQDRTNQNKGV